MEHLSQFKQDPYLIRCRFLLNLEPVFYTLCLKIILSFKSVRIDVLVELNFAISHHELFIKKHFFLIFHPFDLYIFKVSVCLVLLI